MNKNTMIILIVVLAIILVGSYVAMSKQDSVDTSSNENPGTLVSSSEAKSFTVTSTSFKFDPVEIRVRKGDRVKIVLNNTEGFHDLKIDEFNVATKKINGAGTDTIEFTADKTGTFEYYCSVGNHRQMGMVGKLIVE